MKKRLVALILAAVMALGTMTGCASEVDGSAVVAEVADEEITLDVANFYARYQQAQYETYYASFLGENMWSGDAATGYDYEASVKANIMSSLQALYVIRQHAGEYGIELTDAEKAEISEAAKDFLDGNALEAKEAISASQEVVEELLNLLTYETKMYNAMVADVDTEVSDDEAAQKKMQYVVVSTKVTETHEHEDGETHEESTELTEEELKAAKEELQAFADEAETAEDFAVFAESKGYEVKTQTFDASTEVPDEAVIKSANIMSEGQVSDVIVGEDGLYVVNLISVLDRDATETRKASIVNERKQNYYTELYQSWLEETETKVHNRVWDSVDFEKVGVKIKSATEE